MTTAVFRIALQISSVHANTRTTGAKYEHGCSVGEGFWNESNDLEGMMAGGRGARRWSWRGIVVFPWIRWSSKGYGGVARHRLALFQRGKHLKQNLLGSLERCTPGSFWCMQQTSNVSVAVLTREREKAAGREIHGKGSGETRENCCSAEEGGEEVR
ncbi:hypothetical protein ANTPLA_LOCUS4354 [Anthophora plagiata]